MSTLEGDRIQELFTAVTEEAKNGSPEQAWSLAEPLLRAQAKDETAAAALARLVARGAFSRSDGLVAARALASAHPSSIVVMSRLGNAFQQLHDIDYLNAEPPSDPLFTLVARTLVELLESGSTRSESEEVALVEGLYTAARLLGRSWDKLAEQCSKRLIELSPDSWTAHYDAGLFYKTRGRFEEGCRHNQRAYELGGSESDAVRWNLGICATGARDAGTALSVWKSLGNHIELGRFGLPDGEYGDVKVRLAERPLAERDPAKAPDEPGEEETVWVERLSPCHGIIRSALYAELGVDFGDVVLFDGAPITYHEYDGERVPVFPHLVTLARNGYRIVQFGGTQAHAHQIAELSKQLPADAVLYVHTEQFRVLCANCWENYRDEHARHREVEHAVVTGKLCAPADIPAAELLKMLDSAVASAAGVQLLLPDLVRECGYLARADVEARRLAMIVDN